MEQELELEFDLITEQYPYELLLLADETKEAIDRYLYDADVYTVKESGTIIAVFCLLRVDAFTVELKNIAVAEPYQGKRIGSTLLSFIKKLCAGTCSSIIVGTPDCAHAQLRFYRKNGFKDCSVRKDFYLHNYSEPIYENGILLRDMLVLQYELNV